MYECSCCLPEVIEVANCYRREYDGIFLFNLHIYTYWVTQVQRNTAESLISNSYASSYKQHCPDTPVFKEYEFITIKLVIILTYSKFPRLYPLMIANLNRIGDIQDSNLPLSLILSIPALELVTSISHGYL